MSLDRLNADVRDAYSAIGDDVTVELDRETRNELAMLSAVFDSPNEGELVRRAIHALYRSTVDTGNLDFHLRRAYDVTYDEYLYGELEDTYEDASGHAGLDRDDERRYQQ
ncbi:hypothetical protein EI982_05435 [Haloplanus rallus]|jgi:hypothetical protein|uniref:Uncharacterized protein n=1 Tax=Haloplanus rallus TaxID=1816183 RepID=A0A6B9F767_9EURY|nr:MULTISPECIES: hypothetical protein [Haloplanus]QGX94267.1 hypothetical protein EI982_05435 [Haloplanus rallus]